MELLTILGGVDCEDLVRGSSSAKAPISALAPAGRPEDGAERVKRDG